jgi:hypothetical protein
MKRIIWIPLIILPIIILVFWSGTTSNDNRKSITILASNKIVLIELFTSQGCSSCPSADRLLGSYANRNDVAALSFHVDYWNRLGWKDPFSNPQFSQRQNFYASAFKASGVYTPQVIINGEREMVGSDKNKIDRTINELQKQQSSSQIIIDEIKIDNNKVSVIYSVSGKVPNSAINVALVQNKILTSIKSGENKGLMLTNYNVVRNFKTINSFSTEKNTTMMDMVSGIDKKEFSLVMFLQDESSNKIYSATKKSL